MRKEYEKVLKEFFHKKVFHRRDELAISQEEMAYRLAMSGRSYVDLEHGKSCCGALTLALFLIYICADPMNFLEGLRNAFESIDKKAA